MTAIANFRVTEYASLVPAKGTYEQAANVLLYGGTIVTKDANGRADVVTAGQHALGIAAADYDNRTTAPEGGGAGAIDCEVMFGVFGLSITGTDPVPGEIVYVVDNQTVSTDSSSQTRGIAGICVEVRADSTGTDQAYVFMGPLAIAVATNALNLETNTADIATNASDIATNASDIATNAADIATNAAAIVYITVADKAALKAVAAADRSDGMLALVQADNSLWAFNSTSTAAEDTADELVQAPAAGTGRWLRADKSFIMKIPISFANTDGEAIETIPAGFALRLAGFPYWKVTTGWTGGTSSAIGISTNISGYETGGDLLGGAGGDVAATLNPLVAGDIAGTLGGELDDNVGFQALMLVEASEIQFDRIVDAFTAGAGFACIPVVQVAT